MSTTELMEIVCEDVFNDSDKVHEMELAYDSYFPTENSNGNIVD